MIKNIFIPETIGSYYLFEQKIVGIEINKDYILATKVIAKGKKRTITNIYSEIIDNSENLKEVLISLKSRLGSFDKVYVSLPTSFAIFKDLELSFIGVSKAKMVAPFEIESALPFSINQAVVDSIVIDEDKANKKTYLITAAIKKQTIENYINSFKEAGIKIDKLSLDIFELYSLYKNLNNLENNKITTLINLDLTNTTIAIIIDKKLRYIRSLPRGIATGENKTTINKLIESGLKSDFDKITSDKSHEEKYKDLASQVKFTVDTILKNLEIKNIKTDAVITGFGSQIIGMPEFICNSLKSNCRVLSIKEIVKNGIYSNINNIPNQYLLSIATALPDAVTSDFSLMPNQDTKTSGALVNQVLTLFSLSILSFVIFFTYSFIKVRQIKNSTLTLENQAVRKLKTTFNLKQAKNLRTVNRSAQQTLDKQKDTISQILDKNSYSFLTYLDELNRVIDKERLGLKIDRMIITSDQISIQGSVKNIEDAKLFENQIEQSPIFSIKTTLQTPDFTKNPMIIEINKTKEN